MLKADRSGSFGRGLLDWVERAGNRLPDPAVLFLGALLLTWGLSVALAGVDFGAIDPRTGNPLRIQNQLTGHALAAFLSSMVGNYVGFPPLGVVLVMVLGVGVAEHSGLVGAGLRQLLDVSPRRFLTPILVTASIASHLIADAALIVVVPLGGAIFYAAGRHPIAGIVAAFTGVAGAFAANFLPSGLDPLLQGFTQKAAQILDPSRTVNPLCNWGFMAAASLPIILASWWITDRIVEPRLARTPVDGDPEEMPQAHPLSRRERRALWITAAVVAVGALGLAAAAAPADSSLRASDGSVTTATAPLMRGIIPLMFLFTAVPGVVFGYLAGTIRGHKDIIKGMTHTMSSMSYYLVMIFFAALFTTAFSESNLGALLALKGAALLRALALPPVVTVIGIIVLSAGLDMIVGSASAKWAVLSPILVPMLMAVGISPELTQMAYRIGDSPVNIVTPLNPYFPLIVAFCVRYVRNTGLGTLISLTVPYAVAFVVILTLSLTLYWAAGLPLGIQATYTYP